MGMGEARNYCTHCVSCEKQNIAPENCNHKCHYKCKLCGIFINKKMKIFHCEECKKCYVGEKKYFQHCFSCQMCIGRATEHKCLEEKIQNRNCSICLDSLISDD